MSDARQIEIGNTSGLEDEWLEWYRLTPQSAGGKARSSGIFSCKWEARLTPNPILKVLSELNQSGVQYLLMGGQACVLYGGAEFSRDTDIAVLAEAENLRQLAAALDQLQAEPIAVPPLEAKYLLRAMRCISVAGTRMPPGSASM